MALCEKVLCPPKPFKPAAVFVWEPLLPSLFLMVESWTLTLTEASEACSSSDVVCGVFCDLLDELSLHYWGNFGRPGSLLGRFHHCSMFFTICE